MFFVIRCHCLRPVPECCGVHLERGKSHGARACPGGLRPRPPGSEALEKCRDYLVRQLEGYGYQVKRMPLRRPRPTDQKDGQPHRPQGSRRQKRGRPGQPLRYQIFEDFRFVGANDGGSSTGLLLELARVLAAKKDSLDYWLLFLDGEEAFVDWSSFDSTYGSRHLASRWKQDGTAAKVRALLLLDMIGERTWACRRTKTRLHGSWILFGTPRWTRAFGISSRRLPPQFRMITCRLSTQKSPVRTSLT